MRALVSGTYGAYYKVLPEPELSAEILARLAGRLRLDLRQRKDWTEKVILRHPLMVGDRVEIEPPQSGESTITAVHPRTNAVYRSSGDQLQGLGANVDRAIIMISLANPGPRFQFLDRVLASVYAAGVPSRIVFSKADLAPDDTTNDALSAEYQKLGYTVVRVNLIQEPLPQALGALLEETGQGATLLVGNSGTGKSTLLNRILNRTAQKTGEVSRGSGLGKHTTTNSRLIVHPSLAGVLIDTPGVADFGVLHMTRRQIIDSFPEFRLRSQACEYDDCEHELNNRGCGVWPLLSGETALPADVHPERRRSLLAMLDSLSYVAHISRGDYVKATGRIRTGKIRQKAKED